MTPTTVVHHSADMDGIFCREIARKFIPDAKLIGWDFADPPLEIPSGKIYVLDLPVDRVFGFKYEAGDVGGKPPQQPGGLIWIDHHKSSIETHPKDIPGYRIDGVAACRLAWQWFSFFKRTDVPGNVAADALPTKDAFVQRNVEEPLAVRLAGEYDVWDRRDPRADVFQFGLRSCELSPKDWEFLLSPNEVKAHELLGNGVLLQNYQQRNDASAMHRSFLVEFEGLTFLALTTVRCNSLTFASKDVPETGHDALMGLYFGGKRWTVSLYHAKHRTDIDLSKIAVKHGGGGHAGACGFQAETLPFIP
jgi:hypothetical protein